MSEAMLMLEELLKIKERTTIGLMSGTSADGVDIACCRVNVAAATLKNIASATIPYPASLRDEILSLVSRGSAPLTELAALSHHIGEFYAEAVLDFLANSGLKQGDIELIGSHGQTVAHLVQPLRIEEREHLGTIQIGEPEVVAKRLGITTVSDFRWADIAVGGRGAPLTPLYHQHRFGSDEKTRLIVNIGGISNITLLCDKNHLDATDCGPGNCLVDHLLGLLYSENYDKGGQVAASGYVEGKLLDRLKQDVIFRRELPAALDRREIIGMFDRCDVRLPTESQSKRDLVATVAELTPWSIRHGCEIIGPGKTPQEIIVCGGGVHNQYFMSGLQNLFSSSIVSSTETFGSDPDYVEAECFAYLANLTLNGAAGNVPQVTGATRQVVAGKISQP
jgi:anhydro-N-acetylmuramic acid kinase